MSRSDVKPSALFDLLFSVFKKHNFQSSAAVWLGLGNKTAWLGSGKSHGLGQATLTAG